VNTANAKQLVVVSTLGTGLLTVIALYHKGKTPTPRVGVGVIASGVILATVAEVAPEIAAGFAVLMLTTAVFVVGGDAWAGLAAATAATPAK
jgi:hypothetical protein